MYKQGDILMIPVPFTDLSSQKKRPVLVLSKSDYNTKADDLIVAAITSNVVMKAYTVLFTNKDMSDGELQIDSCIRADKMYTLSQDIVIKYFGAVNKKISEQVKTKIAEIMNEED